jgi:hypothetical protein
MSEALARLAKRIRKELDDLEKVLQRIEEGWDRFQRSTDDYYLDGVALNIPGFYSGLERVFELIVTTVDGKKPGGGNWHQVLLRKMTDDIDSIRPAVISNISYKQLDEYRGFRHVVRNVYTYEFNPEKVKKLVEQAPGVYSRVHAELLAFADFLEK